MLFKPSVFRPPSRESVVGVIHAYPFAELITHLDGELEISHLPFIFEAEESELGTLYVHLAKVNSHYKTLDRGALCTIVFRGPESFISGSWYGPESEDHIPTWNYVTVHCVGHSERVKGDDKIFWQMSELHRRNDFSAGLEVTEDEKKILLPQVALYKIPVLRCESVFKLNQNRSDEDRHRVSEVLKKSEDSRHQALGRLMAESLAVDKRN